jgi:hypothetical protein
MIAELLAILVQIVQLIWPLRIVEESEVAGRFVCGHWWKEVGPGCYWVVPWFMDVKALSIAKGIVTTPRLDIPLSDGNRLSFSASSTCRVVDVKLALLAMDDYKETTQELLSAVIADKLMDVDAERVTNPEKRGRLFSDLRRWVQDEGTEYGLELTRVRFTSLVIDAPVMRLLSDQGGTQW